MYNKCSLTEGNSSPVDIDVTLHGLRMKEKERSSLKMEKLSSIMDGEDRQYISKAFSCILKEKLKHGNKSL